MPITKIQNCLPKAPRVSNAEARCNSSEPCDSVSSPTMMANMTKSEMARNWPSSKNKATLTFVSGEIKINVAEPAARACMTKCQNKSGLCQRSRALAWPNRKAEQPAEASASKAVGQTNHGATDSWVKP